MQLILLILFYSQSFAMPMLKSTAAKYELRPSRVEHLDLRKTHQQTKASIDQLLTQRFNSLTCKITCSIDLFSTSTLKV